MTGRTGSKEQLHGGRVEGVLAKSRHDKSRCNIETWARKCHKNNILAGKSLRITCWFGAAARRKQNRAHRSGAQRRCSRTACVDECGRRARGQAVSFGNVVGIFVDEEKIVILFVVDEILEELRRADIAQYGGESLSAGAVDRR